MAKLSRPDRRGMGAQSDFIGETFVPSTQYKAQQADMVQRLIATGFNLDQLDKLFLVPAGPPSDHKPKEEQSELLRLRNGTSHD